jgi:hypothetical protein
MPQFLQLPSAQMKSTATRVRNIHTKSDVTHIHISPSPSPSSSSSSSSSYSSIPVAPNLEHRAFLKRFVSLQCLNLKQSVRLLGLGISPSQGRYLTQTE